MLEKGFYMNRNELTGIMPPEPALLKDIQKDWLALCKAVHHAFEYGFHCNDMTHGEVEEDIASALDRFAKKNCLPEHDWDADYEEKYGDSGEENPN